mmetsp:Transcript_161584/g.310358  ORF Transcript_161584/g.310358 Transcript_161584/m.310358 type:complete len:398 (-) Transcript_161584:63-1256(-)
MQRVRLLLFCTNAALLAALLSMPLKTGGNRPRHLSSTPLVSVMILTTADRYEYLQFAIRQVLDQTYPNIEVVVVDDSDSELANLPILPQSGNATVQYHHFHRQMSIGEKRNAAVALTSGEVVVTWDNDDLYPPDRIEKQTQPIFRGDVDITVLKFDQLGWVKSRQVSYFKLPIGEHCGTLTFRRSIWGGAVVYPNVSVSEDVYFADQAVRSCARVRILDVSNVYVRHSRMINTWTWRKDSEAGTSPWGGKLTSGSSPSYVTPEAEMQLLHAEAALGNRKHRTVLNQWIVPGFFDAPMFWPDRVPEWCAAEVRRNAPEVPSFRYQSYSSSPPHSSHPHSSPPPPQPSTLFSETSAKLASVVKSEILNNTYSLAELRDGFLQCNAQRLRLRCQALHGLQ